VIRRSEVALAVLVMGLGVGVDACAPPASTAPPSAPARPAPPLQVVDAEAVAVEACRQTANELRTWLAEVDALGWPISASLDDEGRRLVARVGPALDDPAPVVHLTSSALFLDGFRAPDVGALGERLGAWLELRRRTLESSPFLANPRLYLAVDADLPWSRVVATVERAASSGFERVAFVFVDPSRSPPPLAPSMSDADLAKLSDATPRRRQQLLAEELAFVHKDCPSTLQVVAQLGHELPEVDEALIEQLPAALEACRCRSDMTLIKSSHWALFGNPHRGSMLVLPLAQPGTAPQRTLRAAAAALWSDTHELVTSTASRGFTSVAFALDAAST
jgi:hypothetical protein